VSHGPNVMGGDVVRFWRKVNRNGPIHPTLGTRCWLWKAYVKPNGYGEFRIDGKMDTRIAWSGPSKAFRSWLANRVCTHATSVTA
jgi:hypothetical protein